MTRINIPFHIHTNNWKHIISSFLIHTVSSNNLSTDYFLIDFCFSLQTHSRPFFSSSLCHRCFASLSTQTVHHRPLQYIYCLNIYTRQCHLIFFCKSTNVLVTCPNAPAALILKTLLFAFFLLVSPKTYSPSTRKPYAVCAKLYLAA